MIINKFGGASVKNAESIKRMAEICRKFISNGIVVVSAMGKTTNLLEKIVNNYFQQQPTDSEFNEFVNYHNTIINELFENSHEVNAKVFEFYHLLEAKLNAKPGLNFDFEYDQIVPFGELVSTTIISSYLTSIGLNAVWTDVKDSIRTDNNYRDAKVDFELSGKLIKQNFPNFQNALYITQGFIGADKNNLFTTLGREGSDYTAAILGNILNAEKVTVWKDVPGIMCADPQWMPSASKIDRLSYLDAIELAFFGAKVIHPKTIKPLQNKNIPLQVRSFINTDEKGTLINGLPVDEIPPVYIKKEQQVLISIKPFDFSFIVEENLSHIFGILAKNQIKVNLMQNGAISFSITVDNDLGRVPKAIEELKKHYDVKYNEPLELITIRHTKPGAEKKVIDNRKILVEQKSRSVARFVVR